MSLFGNPLNVSQTERKTGTLFGSTSAPTGGLFGQSQQQTNTAQPTSLFGSAAAAQPKTGSLFGTPSQQQNTGSLFGQSQQQPQTGSLFGQPPPQQQQRQQPAQTSGTLFGQSQQQQANMNNSLFGGLLNPAPALNTAQQQQLMQQQQALPQLRQSSATPFAGAPISGARKSIMLFL